ncbi:hypothetical protein [Hyphomicrobium sp.]|uniref:hypothetical protein n=1 Tax=Hyphomicrobium sp. TaxID=82 RepID=UPI002B9208DF|nr:hypothetical protein [Hyphomicrobium sp.]HRN89057.1 hypothetical protein [Hyphomicrobium sp.]HRQ27263.1 hypothetical protein [Hyphomicrobium sp.]
MKYKTGMLIVLLTCTGCASSSDEITAQYVSPIQYETYSCQQIGAEAQRISNRAASVAGIQDSKSTNDAVAMGVGLVLFWPSLFFIKGDGHTAAELARLRGEFEALEQVSIQKNCGIQFQPTPPAKNQRIETSSIPKPLQ